MKKICIAIGALIVLATSIQGVEAANPALIKKIICPPANMVKAFIDKHLSNINDKIIAQHGLSANLRQQAKIPYNQQQVTVNAQPLAKGLQCGYVINVGNKPVEFFSIAIVAK